MAQNVAPDNLSTLANETTDVHLRFRLQLLAVGGGGRGSEYLLYRNQHNLLRLVESRAPTLGDFLVRGWVLVAVLRSWLKNQPTRRRKTARRWANPRERIEQAAMREHMSQHQESRAAKKASDASRCMGYQKGCI